MYKTSFLFRILGVGLVVLSYVAPHPRCLAQPIIPPPVICGQDILHHIMREHYPELQQAFENTFEGCRAEATRKTSGVSERSVLTIPVVIHVVWKNLEENLHDSILLDQIAVLNEDYNRLNADTGNLRAIFQAVAGDAQIRFELDEIRRVQTNADFRLNILGGEILANLKSTAQGRSDAKDPTRYLNIWICRIQPVTILGIPLGQVLGFAFPPNNLPNWPANSGAPSLGQDGVVLDFRTIGRNNPNPMPNPGGSGNLAIRGRTATHEVGHYLGLRHIWGDGGLLGLPNDCNQSDGIDDTPFVNAQSSFDCNKSRNTCVKVEPHYGMDMPDLVENYMDYSSETCMNMFTKGQVNHMRAVLEGPRKTLVQSSSTSSAVAQDMPAVYPNPATGSEFWLSIPPNWQNSHLSLFSADGRLQLERRIESAMPSGMRVGAETLTKGWYFLRLQQGSRLWSTRIFVNP